MSKGDGGYYNNQNHIEYRIWRQGSEGTWREKSARTKSNCFEMPWEAYISWALPHNISQKIWIKKPIAMSILWCIDLISGGAGIKSWDFLKDS